MLACLVDGEPSTSRTVIASQLCDRAYRQRGEREVFEHWRAQLKWHAQTARKVRHDDRLPLGCIAAYHQPENKVALGSSPRGRLLRHDGFQQRGSPWTPTGVAIALALWPTVSGVNS